MNMTWEVRDLNGAVITTKEAKKWRPKICNYIDTIIVKPIIIDPIIVEPIIIDPIIVTPIVTSRLFSSMGCMMEIAQYCDSALLF